VRLHALIVQTDRILGYEPGDMGSIPVESTNTHGGVTRSGFYPVIGNWSCKCGFESLHRYKMPLSFNWIGHRPSKPRIGVRIPVGVLFTITINIYIIKYVYRIFVTRRPQ
jgi:hypothetical protein